MKIASPDLISATAWPGKVCYLVNIQRCNYRCGFCNVPELIFENSETPVLTEEKVLSKLERLKDKKFIDAVCITGGEPLIHPEIENFIRKIRKFKFPVRIETNGSQPSRLKRLIEYGLIQSVSLDIKTSREKYNLAAGCKVKLRKIEKSILITSHLDDYEFRTTIVPHLVNKRDVIRIKNWLLYLTHQDRLNSYILQQFKPGKLFKPYFDKVKPYPKSTLEEMKKSVEKYFKKCEIR